MKRIISAILAAVLLAGCAASFTSCGSKKPQKAKPDHVYRVSTIDYGSDNMYMSNIFTEGGKLFVTFNTLNPRTENYEMVDYEVDTDAKKLIPAELKHFRPDQTEMAKNNKYLTNFMYCPDGSGWYVYSEYNSDPKTGEFTEKYTLVRLDKDGKTAFEKDVNDVLAASKIKYEYNYINRMEAAGDSVVIVDSHSNLYLLGTDGNVKKVFALGGGSDNYMEISGMYAEGNEIRLISIDYQASPMKTSYVRVDTETGAIRQTELPAETFRNVWNFFTGPGYDFYYNTDSAICGYDAAKNESVELMNFLNSDCTSNVANRLFILSPDKFVSNGYDEVENKQVLAVLEKVPEDQIQEKYLITLATLGNGWQAKRDAVRFNRTSDEYRVIVKEYSIEDFIPAGSENYDWEKATRQALEAMNNDITSGNPPDILFVSSEIPVENYAAKGMLVDLYDYIDKDPRVSREDFLENILKAQEIGGKLYSVMPTFSVTTFAGKTKNLNGMMSWTMDKFTQWANALPEDVRVFREITRDNMLRNFFTYAYDDFIDPATGRCSFDTPEFRKLLEFIKTLPEKSIWEQMENGGEYDQKFWDDYENALREDRVMLETVSLGNYSSYRSIASYTFGTDEITLIGLPVVKGNGGSLESSLAYSIFKKSKLKDGAWDFVCYYLQKEYQTSSNVYQFPIRKDALEELAAKTLKQEEEMFASQESTRSDEIIYSSGGGVTAVAKPYYGGDLQVRITQDVIDSINAYIKSVSRTSRTNLSVVDIVREEAGPFFADQKSLDETVKIIQNRVSTLIAESR